MKTIKLTLLIAMSLLAALAMPVGMAAQDNPTQDPKPKHKKYKLIDLGTFGGPASYVGGNGPGNPFLNNQGIVGGGADTSIPDPNYPNCANPDCFVSHAFRWQNGVRTDLGALPGVNSTGAGASPINGLPWIVGTSQNGAIDPLINFPAIHAVLWRDNQILDLGTLGGYESGAGGGNSRGQIVGFSTNTIPDQFSGFGVQARVFLWEKGVMRDLGTLGGRDIVPFCNTWINENGQVIGGSFTSSIPNQNTGIPTADPFLWERGVMHDLGGLGGTIGAPCSINNRGQVTGFSDLAGDFTFHPFLWNRGRIIDLGTLGGDTGQGNDINDAGEVVGVADLPDGGHDGFLWRSGTMIDLGNLGATSNAQAINSKHQVVGASRMADGITIHAFLWENGGPIVDLNTLIPQNAALQLIVAQNINERGEIAGIGVPGGCQPVDDEVCGHAYVLIPDGDSDADNEARIAATQNRIATERAPGAQHEATAQRADSPLTPIERIRSMMRQRYHIHGSQSLPLN